jgi:hypothetical protein
MTMTMKTFGCRLATSARNIDIVSALTKGSTRLSIAPSWGLTAQVLAHQTSADHRTDALGGPASARVAQQPEPPFILEHQPNRPTLLGLAFNFFLDLAFEFF